MITFSPLFMTVEEEDVVATLLSITWDTMTDAALIDLAGNSMEYTANGGSSWTTITTGSSKTLATGTGPYELKETVAHGAVTQCIFGYEDTENITGDMVVEGGSNLTDCGGMFYYGHNLDSLDVSGMDTSNVTGFEYMFAYVAGITILDLSSFDTTNAENMEAMFYHMESVTEIDVTSFDTSGVNSLINMFKYCYVIDTLDVSGFVTTSLTGMYGMFYRCGLLPSIDISNFDITNVSNMSSVFYHCDTITSLDFSNVDFTTIDTFDEMLRDCGDLVCITNIDTTNSGATKSGLFMNCSSLDYPNTSDQGDITSSGGDDWVNGGNCPA